MPAPPFSPIRRCRHGRSHPSAAVRGGSGGQQPTPGLQPHVLLLPPGGRSRRPDLQHPQNSFHAPPIERPRPSPPISSAPRCGKAILRQRQLSVAQPYGSSSAHSIMEEMSPVSPNL